MLWYDRAEQEYEYAISSEPVRHGWLMPSGLWIDLAGDDHRIFGQFADDGKDIFNLIGEGGVTIHTSGEEISVRLNPWRITGAQKESLSHACAEAEEAYVDIYGDDGCIEERQEFHVGAMGTAYLYMCDRIAYDMAVSERDVDEEDDW